MARQLLYPIQLIDGRPEAESPRIPPKQKQNQHAARFPGANVVVLGAAAGFAIGILLWGLFALSVLTAVDDLSTEPKAGPTAAEADGTEVLNCANFGAVRALSADDEARFQAQCGPTTPISSEAPAAVPAAPAPAQQAPATAGNRASCDQIRGTEYHSGEERTWYLANCVRR